MEHVIEYHLIESIDAKRKKIMQDPYFDEELRDKKFQCLQEESALSSGRLESIIEGIMGSEGVDYDGRIVSDKTYGREAKEALDWGIANYEGFVDRDFIVGVGSRANPMLRYPFIRDTAVRIPGVKNSPPSYGVKLRIKLAEFYDQVNSFTHPVDKALYSHLHIFALQPFVDGNKRASRAIQNSILCNNGYAPIVIGLDDSDFYFKSLLDAYESYYDRISDGKTDELSIAERNLFRWLGTKCNNSMNNVLRSLESEKKFIITVDYKGKFEKGKQMAVNRVLKNLMRARDSSGFARNVKNSRNKFKIKGDITRVDLYAVLDSLSIVKRYDVARHKNGN